MSLIEQAAKRLEELRRAGAEAGPDTGAIHPSALESKAGDVEHLATPEAAVRELNTRGHGFTGRNTSEPAPTPAACRIQEIPTVRWHMALMTPTGRAGGQAKSQWRGPRGRHPRH